MNDFSHHNPLLSEMKAGREVFWINPSCDNRISPDITKRQIADAADRLLRFAPYIRHAFPQTEHSGGLIESPLVEIPAMRQRLEETAGMNLGGKLYLKCDNQLPISGSIKARGGIYEVLWYAEKIAMENGSLSEQDDYGVLAGDDYRRLFSGYSIAVGSTGNLGLSIGIMGAQLGFRVSVHMSADARKWKKDLLREKGARVIEYSGDYEKAVAEGRRQAQRDPRCHFVDDENSKTLFLGYSVAAARLCAQLREQEIVVDRQHPLFVYLPCGVGGGPGGIAFGLKQCLGEHVHCLFAEPVQAPCMLLGVMSGLHDKIAVQDIGLTGKTTADGLAVGRPSGLVGRLTGNLLDGLYTLSDQRMDRLVGELYTCEGIFVEPSGAAGLPGICLTQQSSGYMARFSRQQMDRATHIAWATGGNMVPQEEREQYLSR